METCRAHSSPAVGDSWRHFSLGTVRPPRFPVHSASSGPPPTSSKAPANETAAYIEQPVPTSEFTALDLNNTGQATSMARVYADVNANMPRAYWDYDSVNISWGVLENYEVVRKIGMLSLYHY